MTGISNNYNLNRVDYQKTQKNEKEEKQVVEEAKVEEKKPEENAKAVDLGNQASALYGQAMIKPKKAEAADVNNDRPEKIDVEREEDPNNPVEKVKYRLHTNSGVLEYDNLEIDHIVIDIYPTTDGHWYDLDGNNYDAFVSSHRWYHP